MSDVRKLGLGYAFDEVPTVTEIARGHTPTGKPGYLLVDESRMNGFTPQYRPQEQTWRKFGTMAVGFYNDAPPKPKDLERNELLTGRYATLSDGNEWIVPIIYVWQGTDRQTKLPKFVDVDEHGNFCEGEVIEKYLPLVERMGPFFDQWCEAVKIAAADGGTFAVDYKPEDCAAILATNYRVGPKELAMGRVLQQDVTAALVIWIACDLKAALDYLIEYASEKKSGEPTLDTSPIAAGHAA